MAIHRLEDAALEEAQERLRTRAREATPPRPRNTGAVIELGEAVLFAWRGRPYRAFVGYKTGTELADLWARLGELGESVERERLGEYRDILDGMVRLFKHIARPTVRPWRLIRRARIALGLYRNPFRDATEREIGDLVVFFSTLRTRRRGRGVG
ncbi:MAG: hypothetical protein ACODAE_09255 [Gemmatimonadota bacterium]